MIADGIPHVISLQNANHSDKGWKATSIPKYKSLHEILMDHKLAALGDAYVNFIFSLALTRRSGEPKGSKVDSRVLAEALKRAGLRNLLPSRISRHVQADAAEAVIVYAWVQNLISLEESVEILTKRVEDPVEAFRSLLVAVKERETSLSAS